MDPHSPGPFPTFARIREALAFDDVLVVPAYSTVLPHATDTRTRLTRRIGLNIPLISAAMDTVTEDAMAIARTSRPSGCAGSSASKAAWW